MSTPTSTKPYMLRAMHEWCVDNGFTPYLAVQVDADTRVPMGFVKDGEIVLNINYTATRDLMLGNDAITFSARFNGVSTDLYVPVKAVRGIFARESGQGLFFEPDEMHQQGNEAPQPEPEPPAGSGKPKLRVVK